nr:unnamed protein product [Digitaria exilis]
MRKAKRGGGDLTRSFRKCRRDCKTDWVSGRLRDGDQDVCTKQSDWFKSDFCRNVIQVRHEGKEVYMGFLAEYDLDHNFAVVNVRTFLDVHVGMFQRALESVPCGDAFVVCRGVSGELMARSLVLGGDLRISKDDEDLDSSSEAGIGGPLVTLDGDVLGMNFYDKKIGTPFLLWKSIHKILATFIGKSDPSGVALWKMDEDAARLNRWPVPMPCWCLRDYVDEDRSDDDDDVMDPKYGYVEKFFHLA